MSHDFFESETHVIHDSISLIDDEEEDVLEESSLLSSELDVPDDELLLLELDADEESELSESLLAFFFIFIEQSIPSSIAPSVERCVCFVSSSLVILGCITSVVESDEAVSIFSWFAMLSSWIASTAGPTSLSGEFR